MEWYFTNLDFPEIAVDFPSKTLPFLEEIGRVFSRYNPTPPGRVALPQVDHPEKMASEKTKGAMAI